MRNAQRPQRVRSELRKAARVTMPSTMPATTTARALRKIRRIIGMRRQFSRWRRNARIRLCKFGACSLGEILVAKASADLRILLGD